MQMLVFPFGYQSYVSQLDQFSQELTDDVNQINQLMTHSTFSNMACNDQEVYAVSQDQAPAFNALKLKLRSYLQSKDKLKYQLARTVDLW